MCVCVCRCWSGWYLQLNHSRSKGLKFHRKKHWHIYDIDCSVHPETPPPNITKLCENSFHVKQWRSCKPRSTARNVQEQCENQIYPTYQHTMTKHDPFQINSTAVGGTVTSSLESDQPYQRYMYILSVSPSRKCWHSRIHARYHSQSPLDLLFSPWFVTPGCLTDGSSCLEEIV